MRNSSVPFFHFANNSNVKYFREQKIVNMDFLGNIDQLGLIFLGWFFILFSLYVTSHIPLGWKLGKASVDWPTTRGEIFSSEVEFDGEDHKLCLEYFYCINGQRYECDTLTYRGYYCDEISLESIVARLPVGLEVDVYYDPHSPEVAVLEPGVDLKSYIIFAIILLILFALGIGMNVAAFL